ncbi:MAG: formate dehydrogenase subunit gamma [Geminicoccaceae bacterium]|nr:formate dehydrogenase subunit gamma [Geminicoccaceae bacterium]MCS7268619.1 formate dehydrogenase subunit gamma [Geminicoccaceae bacterium]MCX7631156.1 formate dehydrogenase subunit gamma [Geminicoccaceae bacterium]MDW8342626.1 formate dehydrogenase subunit gamma [Geminicoccaceae bacterium]
MSRGLCRWTRGILIALLPLLFLGAFGGELRAQAVPGVEASPPATLLPEASRADVWRAVRRGEQGYVAAPNMLGGQLIQSEGEVWRQIRLGAYKQWSAWILLGAFGLVALFFALRGRVPLEGGPSGRTIERFNGLERFAHWLTATTFILLALTGLNLMFGRTLLLPLVGKDVFAVLTQWGKLLHNYLAFGFMLGIVLMFVLWVRFNVPNRYDVIWILKGGGLVGRAHPPSKRFNAGQKFVFWSVILLGGSLSLSGLQLLFPFTFSFFDPTFATLNAWFGTQLPTGLSPIAEQQLATLWHGFVAVILIAIIIGHIYIGSLGMEGAFAAMGSGRVDYNWAKQHHDLWVAELEKRGVVPAE